jgi:hypothetical protein
MVMRVGGATLALAIACNPILGIEEAELDPGFDGPSGPTTASAAGGGGAGGASCMGDASCDDGKVCTVDRCTAAGCTHDAIDGEPAPMTQVAGDCAIVQCVQGEAQAVADPSDTPDDGKACTEDTCQADGPKITPYPAGKACAEPGGVVCDGKGNCVECTGPSHCTPPETCGGGGVTNQCGCTPTPCADLGLTCGSGTGQTDGCGKTPMCNNAQQDGQESDVDCGGPIGACTTRCPNGKKCVLGSDCASGKCDDATKTCQP